MDAGNVVVLSQTLIRPKRISNSNGPPINDHEDAMYLSSMDLVMRTLPYNRRILFYRLHSTDYPALINRLKDSLASVLADFYPLAGRLRERRVEGGGSRVEVHCNDMGAELVEAEMFIDGSEEDGMSFEEVAHRGFDMRPFFRKLAPWPCYSYLRDEGTAPLLSVQVTKFKDNGISLGVSMSHVLADGFSFWHFMTSWAEYARCESLSLHPVHTRTLMKVEHSSRQNAVFESVEYIEDDPSCNPMGSTEAQRAFQFSKKALSDLKNKAGCKFTTYEVLCAHIWKCASRARGHAHDQKIGFICAANMRNRMEPPLPLGYFGNCLTWGSATATAADLEHETLSQTAARINAAVTSCDNACIQGLLHTLEIYGLAMLSDKVITNGARMRVSSSFKFPAFDVDFGWGKPIATRSVEVEQINKIVFYPGPEGLGSADVCMALPLHAMRRLENDPNFVSTIVNLH